MAEGPTSNIQNFGIKFLRLKKHGLSQLNLRILLNSLACAVA